MRRAPSADVGNKSDPETRLTATTTAEARSVQRGATKRRRGNVIFVDVRRLVPRRQWAR